MYVFSMKEVEGSKSSSSSGTGGAGSAGASTAKNKDSESKADTPITRVDPETGRKQLLIAGEVGNTNGLIYTSLTGYYDKSFSGAGTAQLQLLGMPYSSRNFEIRVPAGFAGGFFFDYMIVQLLRVQLGGRW